MSVVIIGEGEKHQGRTLYNGERVGEGTPPDLAIASDPIDETTLTLKGRSKALAAIALSPKGATFDPCPRVYMEKIAVGTQRWLRSGRTTYFRACQKPSTTRSTPIGLTLRRSIRCS